MEYRPAEQPEVTEKTLYVTEVDVDTARFIIEIDRIEGRPSDEATLRIANARPARTTEAAKDKVLRVSGADVDIARLIIEMNQLDGRPTDEATWRIANAKSAPEQEQ